jgi:hypothetical protein
LEDLRNIPSVRLGKGIRIARLLNSESSRSIGTLKILEAVHRNTRSSSGELEKTRLLLRIPGANNLPEVLNNLILLLVATVIRVLLPVIHVDISDTTNKQL